MAFPRTRHLYPKDAAKRRLQLANEEAARIHAARPKLGEPNTVVEEVKDWRLIIGHDGTYCYVSKPDGISYHMPSLAEGREYLAAHGPRSTGWLVKPPEKNAELRALHQTKPTE